MIIIQDLFDKGIELLKNKDCDNTLELAALLLHTFSLLSHTNPLERVDKKNTRLISDILHYIGKNAVHGITTQDICREFSIGKTTLYDMFKTTLDIPPVLYQVWF